MESTREDLAEYVPEEGTVTMLTTSWCGFCRRLKLQLEREGVTFGEVDIETSEQAAGVVMSLNAGDRTVPTVIFPDGSSATNPSVQEVIARLRR
jgi:mycoredoxin